MVPRRRRLLFTILPLTLTLTWLTVLPGVAEAWPSSRLKPVLPAIPPVPPVPTMPPVPPLRPVPPLPQVPSVPPIFPTTPR